MKKITLTRCTNRKHINIFISNICCYYQATDSGHAKIELTNGKDHTVVESVEQIDLMLSELLITERLQL